MKRHATVIELDNMAKTAIIRKGAGGLRATLLTLMLMCVAGLFASPNDAGDALAIITDNNNTPESTARMEGTIKCKFNWGVTASVDLFFPGKCTSTEGKDPSQMGFGGSAGVKGKYEWSEKWFFESGLLLAFGYSPVDVRVEESANYDAGYYSYDMQRGAIQLPIHAGYRFRLTDKNSIRVSVGTQLSYGFAGSFDYDGEKTLPKFDLYGSDGVWNRFGTDIVAGLHFDIDNLSVGINGNFGVTQMAKRDIFSSHTMNESECRIDFTYWFGRK